MSSDLHPLPLRLSSNPQQTHAFATFGHAYHQLNSAAFRLSDPSAKASSPRLHKFPGLSLVRSPHLDSHKENSGTCPLRTLRYREPRTLQKLPGHGPPALEATVIRWMADRSSARDADAASNAESSLEGLVPES